MKAMSWIPVLACGVCAGALAQSAPSSSVGAASSVPTATAPTNPTTRVLQNARPSGDQGKENLATPQVAVPLKRAAPNPIALKPGKQQANGTVDDSVARCKAERASGVKCEAP